MSKRGDVELDEIEAFFSSENSKQSRYPWRRSDDVWQHRSVRDALGKLFHGKCAFCERHITLSKYGESGHFRPYRGASSLSGDFHPQHYWWLVFEWRNLYPICAQCNRAKRNLFPVEGEYAAVGTPYDELIEDEQPMILDPCIDKPGRFFVFSESGEIAPNEGQRGLIATTQQDFQRAVNTIEVFKLNRSELCRARHEHYLSLREHWDRLRKDHSDELQQTLMSMVADNAEYSGLGKQFLMQWMRRGIGVESVWDSFRGFVLRLQDDHQGVSKKERQETLKAERARSKSASTYSIKSGSDDYRRKLLLTDQTITRVEIKNLRGLRDLSMDSSLESETAPWFMFLGENGVGKSTLLHALTLALIDPVYRKRLDIDPRSFVRKGCQRGYVNIHLSDFEEPIRLEFRNNSSIWRSSNEQPRIPVLAFGATRLMAQEGIRTPRAFRRNTASVDNLFNPFVPLSDPTEWLLQLEPDRFASIVRSLKMLLDLPPRVQFRPNRRRKEIEIPSLNVRSIAELSDGYRTVIAMVVEIMRVLLRHFEVVETAKGIVIIDELGAHLHPRWRMRVVSNLREAFPNIQFIASTHDPLCLRGLVDGETVLLRRFGSYVDTVPDLPDVAGLRVDQILTSEHFGLNTTVDPETEQAFTEYYSLLERADLNEDDKDRLEELKDELGEMDLMGGTRRERLMLEAIDRHMARSPISGNTDDLEAELMALMEA